MRQRKTENGFLLEFMQLMDKKEINIKIFLSLKNI